MSYSQGSVVIVTTTVTDPDTGAAYDPQDLTATISPPSPVTPPPALSWRAGTITRMGPGVFRFLINTTPASGNWTYVVQTVDQYAIVKYRLLRVTTVPCSS